ncbi:hypothetical protein vseg_009033 [Gypsophila vaccaria]
MSTSGSAMQVPVDKPRSKRPACEELEDRISSLPDELRTKIISLLPFEHAFKTCILSRSWKHIFSALPNLSFVENNLPEVEDRVHHFAASIDWTLENYEGPGIDTLEIHFNIRKRSRVQLKREWMNFAVEHNVQNLKLTGKMNARQGLPRSLFTSVSLKEFFLTVKDQLLRLPSAIYLPNLTSMSLVGVGFPNDTLTEKLFAGCPLLTRLGIKNCTLYRLSRLTISCPNLKLICISYCVDIDTCVVDIQSSCIEIFLYDGALARSFTFGNMDRLWTVVLNSMRDLEDTRPDSELAAVALSLLRSLRHAREMTLSAMFNKVLSMLGGGLWQLPYFENMKTVGFFVWATALNEEVVMTLLSKFLRVQKMRLIIHRLHSLADMFHVVMLPKKERIWGILRNLEYLQIDNFEGFPLELVILEFFLQNATSLTEVTIRVPQLAYTQHDEDHYHYRFNDHRRLMIVHELKRLSQAYPRPVINIVDVPQTIH